VYKCPLVLYPRFEDGFSTRELRDSHCKRHERPIKCEHKECDYSAIRFSTKATLTRHIRLCHDTVSDQPVFPKINICPVEKALNNAIEKDNVIAVRALAIEISDLQEIETGFLMHAVQAVSGQ